MFSKEEKRRRGHLHAIVGCDKFPLPEGSDSDG